MNLKAVFPELQRTVAITGGRCDWITEDFVQVCLSEPVCGAERFADVFQFDGVLYFKSLYHGSADARCRGPDDLVARCTSAARRVKKFKEFQ
jgi:hypothetical protein